MSVDQPRLIANGTKYRDAGLKPATGRSGSAQLTVRALLGKDRQTDLEITTGELDASSVAPGTIAKLQVKQFDLDSDLMATINYNNLQGGGYQARRYEALARGMKLQVQGNVSGIDPKRTGVVTVTETVKLRPDLSASLSAPARAKVKTTVNIAATIAELNQDVGARADCVLYIDGGEADRSNGIWVDAGDVVSCAFVHAFQTTGTKALEVKVVNVVPGDYDAGNNAAQASIQVVGGNDFFYSAHAGDHTHTDWWRWSGTWSDYIGNTGEHSNEHSYSGRWQQAWLYAWMPRGVSLPLTKIELSQSTNGTTVHSATYENVSGTDMSWWWGGNCVNRFNGRGAYFYLCSYGNSEYGHTWLQYWRYAGAVTYHSSWYSRYHDAGSGQTYYYSHNYTTAWSSGEELVAFGPDYAFKVELTDGARTYSTRPVVKLDQAYDRVWSYQPYTCWNYEDTYWKSNYCSGHESRQKGTYGWVQGQPD